MGSLGPGDRVEGIGMLLRAEFDSHHQMPSGAVKCGRVQIPYCP